MLNHLYGSDVIWLQRIRMVLPQAPVLASSALDLELTWPTVRVFESFGELGSRREALDALIEPPVEEGRAASNVLLRSHRPMVY